MKLSTNDFSDPLFSLVPTGHLEELFDQVPDIVFFIKDLHGRYVVVNQSLVLRCGRAHKSEIIGRTVGDLFPTLLAERFAEQDRLVLQTGKRIVSRLELHWYPKQRSGWCLTTKLPLLDGKGKIRGLIGISRDARELSDRTNVPTSLMRALDGLENDYSADISPAKLAKVAGLSTLRFSRLIKKIYEITPSQLITRTRLAAAAELLLTSRRSIVDIAHACGFADHSAFSRAFRATSGVTPSQFRNGLTVAPEK
jgi:AraC-like DNA-binding protein